MRRGVDFAQAELATKIRGKYLRALEDEQFELLPGRDVRQGLPAHLRRVPRPRRPALRRRVQLALRQRRGARAARAPLGGAAAAPQPAARDERRAGRARRDRRPDGHRHLGVEVEPAASRRRRPRAPAADSAPQHGDAAALLVVTALRGATHVTARIGSASGQRRATTARPEGRRRRSRSAARALWVQIDSPENLRDPGARQARARAGRQAARDHRHADRLASGVELRRAPRSSRRAPSSSAATATTATARSSPSSLLRLGIDPARITVVGDDPADLEAALRDGPRARPARRLGRARADPRRPHDRAARARGRRRAARRRGAAGRRSRSSRAGSPSA